jgi:hypothetical protein
MKDFILDSTYKDAVIVNSNDDIIITSSNKLPYNPQTHHTINLIDTNLSCCLNSKNNKFNAYNIIDYL